MISDLKEYPYIDHPKYIGGLGVQANEIKRDTGMDNVMFVEFVFFLTPDLDQLRVMMKLSAFTGGSIFTKGLRNEDVVVNYFSQSQGSVLRSWADGEKESILSAIERNFEMKMERWPQNRKAYEKERKRALKALENRKTVTMRTAIEESWSQELLLFELRAAIKHIEELLSPALKDVDVPRAKKRKIRRFNYIDWKGRDREVEGERISSGESRVVYRDRRGNLYSFPKS